MQLIHKRHGVGNTGIYAWFIRRRRRWCLIR